MHNMIILYGEVFSEQFCKLPKFIQRKAVRTEKFFRHDMLHPSLRLHRLHGNLKQLWSISVDKKYRIIFKYTKKDTVLFVSVGMHDIYEEQ